MPRRLVRILVLVLLLAAAGWVAAHWSGVEGRLAAAGNAGMLPFAAAFVLLTMGCFPVSVLGFTAGAVYGPGPGFLLVVPAVACGGLLMFLLGRSVLREPIRRRIAARPRWQALDDLAAAKALRINLLARLSPFNYGLMCYTLAAGRTPLRLYLLGLVGTLPSLAAHVLIGSIVRKGALRRRRGHLAPAMGRFGAGGGGAAGAGLGPGTARADGLAAGRRDHRLDGPEGRGARRTMMSPTGSRIIPFPGPPTAALVLRVELLLQPRAVWRRLLLDGRATFWDLHVAIQDAFGWEDRHLHQFTVDAPDGGPPLHLGIPDDSGLPGAGTVLAGWEHRLVACLRRDAAAALYVYDFAEERQHAVELEGTRGPHRAERPAPLRGRRGLAAAGSGGGPRDAGRGPLRAGADPLRQPAAALGAEVRP